MPVPQRFAVSSTVSSMRTAPASSRIGCARWGWRFEVDQSVSRRAAQSQSCEPPCVEEDVWIDVVSRLAGEALCPVRLGVAHGALVPLKRLVGEGRVWTTATPVVLPGYDHRRGRARPRCATGDRSTLCSIRARTCRYGGRRRSRARSRSALASDTGSTSSGPVVIREGSTRTSEAASRTDKACAALLST